MLFQALCKPWIVSLQRVGAEAVVGVAVRPICELLCLDAPHGKPRHHHREYHGNFKRAVFCGVSSQSSHEFDAWEPQNWRWRIHGPEEALSALLREAYKRRESALMALAEFRAISTNVFLANHIWDWPGADSWYGRFEDNVPRDQGGHGVKKGAYKDTPLHKSHADRVLEIMLRLMDAMQEFLLVPRRGRGRQEFCAYISGEKEQVEEAEMKGRNAVLKLLARLHKAVEDLKAAGMPANEASRINQYNMFLFKNFEKLWSFKTYRTPTTLRSVCRVNIQLMPFFFGPYYVHLARNTEGTIIQGRLIFACVFSCLLSTTLVALLNVAIALENPFRPGLDTLRIQEEFYLCREAIITVADEAKVDWYEKVEFEWEILHHDGGTSSEESA